MRTVNGVQKESLSNNQEISFLIGSMGEGNCSRFLNFCERITNKSVSPLSWTEADIKKR